MEIKGEDFVKKVQLKQEKESLKQRLLDLEAQDIQTTPPAKNEKPSTENMIDLPEQELGDILLADSTEEEVDKKKYIILGLVLIVLFLITIVVIRLVTNSDDSNSDSFVDKKENISQDKALDNENIEQQYQKIINTKLKKLQEEKKAKLDVEEKKADESLNIKKVEKEEIKTIKPKDLNKEIKTKEIKKDLLKLKENPVVKKEIKQVKKVVKPVVKKTTSWPVKKQTLREPELKDFKRAKTADKLSAKAATSKPSGYFVQVGAFSKEPSVEYLTNIKNQGFNFILFKQTVNNIEFKKVLVGPYKDKASATKSMTNIKTKLKIKDAYIKKL